MYWIHTVLRYSTLTKHMKYECVGGMFGGIKSDLTSTSYASKILFISKTIVNFLTICQFYL